MNRETTAPFAQVPLDRVLIVMLAAVGDAVHALPVVNAIKRSHPAARISWVMQRGALTQLLTGHPSIDDVIPFDRAAGWRGFAAVRAAAAATIRSRAGAAALPQERHRGLVRAGAGSPRL